MDVTITRLTADGLAGVRVRRDDGLVYAMPDDRDKHGDLPHDVGHLVGEQAFGVHDGLWGSIAAGAVFKSMTLVEGKPRHDHRRRSNAVLAVADAGIALGEVVVGAALTAAVDDLDLPQAMKLLRRSWGYTLVGEMPYSEAILRQAIADYRDAIARWQSLAVGDSYTVRWAPRPAPRVKQSARTSGR